MLVREIPFSFLTFSFFLKLIFRKYGFRCKGTPNISNVIMSQYTDIVKFFSSCRVSLVKFRSWSKFHVNAIASSRVMTIFLYKGLTKNPEIGNAPVWVLPNIWRLGRDRDGKFGTNVSNKTLLNAAKYQGYNFYRFWVIKGKPTMGKITPHPN